MTDYGIFDGSRGSVGGFDGVLTGRPQGECHRLPGVIEPGFRRIDQSQNPAAMALADPETDRPARGLIEKDTDMLEFADDGSDQYERGAFCRRRRWRWPRRRDRNDSRRRWPTRGRKQRAVAGRGQLAECNAPERIGLKRVPAGVTGYRRGALVFDPTGRALISAELGPRIGDSDAIGRREGEQDQNSAARHRSCPVLPVA